MTGARTPTNFLWPSRDMRGAATEGIAVLGRRRRGTPGGFGSFPAKNQRGRLPRDETPVEVLNFDAEVLRRDATVPSGRIDNKIARHQGSLGTSARFTLGNLDNKIAKKVLARHRCQVGRDMSCDRAGWMLGFL